MSQGVKRMSQGFVLDTKEPVIVDSTTQSTIIPGLMPDTEYVVQVRAIFGGTPGGKSDPLLFTTKPGGKEYQISSH